MTLKRQTRTATSRINKGHLPIHPVSTNLTMAELSLQRGDVERARLILEKRIGQGATDFKTLNMYGVALAHGRHFDNSATLFNRLLSGTPTHGERARASFNHALVQFFRDLSIFGDQSVSYASQFSAASLPHVQTRQPFARSIEIWDSMLRRRQKQKDIIHTYLGFVCLQLGYLEHALSHLASALAQNEGFYITHYALGRVFSDLFLLAAEGNDFSLPPETLRFFEIEKFEVRKEEEDGRLVVNRDTFLDLALQSMLDARELSPLSPCVYQNLTNIYLYSGMVEEAFEAMAHAETLAPNSLRTLEVSLRLHEFVRSGPKPLRNLIGRIKLARRREPVEIYHIIPSYYLF